MDDCDLEPVGEPDLVSVAEGLRLPVAERLEDPEHVKEREGEMVKEVVPEQLDVPDPELEKLELWLVLDVLVNENVAEQV